MDDIAPEVFCHTELVLPLSSDGDAVIWASDLDISSADACSNDIELSFSTTTIVPNMTVDCSNLGNNAIVLYIWDGPTASANMSSCTVNVIVQDNLEVCGPTMNLTAIGGLIMTEQENMVEDVEVSIMSTLMNEPQVDMAEHGEYAFIDMPMNTNYRINAVKDENYLQGISTLDLVMIQRHILGIELLASPYSIIAADVNSSETIDGIDLVELRKLILGIYDELSLIHI